MRSGEREDHLYDISKSGLRSNYDVQSLSWLQQILTIDVLRS
jgi:hypothetical protein